MPVESEPTAPALWQRLFSLYALPPLNNPRIARELQWYADHADYMDRVQNRAEPYLYAIVELIEAHGLPGEIALLPVVESAFQPFAYSSGRAAGIWQFIPATGRHYGLKQNWWYDGRRDIYASTRAAITYLKKLNDDFNGDWLLTLAAYNAGEGTVGRAIGKNLKRGKPTDFWSLDLPRETRRYVPKLIAVASFYANAKDYDITLAEIPNRPAFEVIDTGSQLDIGIAAEMAGVPLEEMIRLNPGFNRWATDPDGPHRLLVPAGRGDLFRAKLARLDESERVQWRRHPIRRGDTLGTIARHYGTTVAALKQVNELKTAQIRAGQHLLIPLSGKPLSLRLASNNRPSSKPKRSAIYTVQRGDTFWEIARKHGIRVEQLVRWNDLDRDAPLHPGLKLALRQSSKTIPGGRIRDVLPMETPQLVNYTVRKGDSLYLISRRFNVSIADLQRWNSSVTASSLRPGQVLEVKVDITQPQS